METCNSLLLSLSPTDYAVLQPCLRRVERKSGSVLYEPEDTVDWVYFPEEGLVSLISVMLSGDQVESAVVGREGGVGILEAAGAGITFSRAVVQIDLVAQRTPAQAYVEAFDASPSFRHTIASHVELTVAESRQTIACIAHHPIEQRLAWWLLECQDRTGNERLPLTQEFLAAMLGAQRTTVTQIASGLRAEGLIDYSRGVISIIDRAGLEARSCECYRTNKHFRALIEASTTGARRRKRAPL
jgi:CRP-like cAMP-binding protein